MVCCGRNDNIWTKLVDKSVALCALEGGGWKIKTKVIWRDGLSDISTFGEYGKEMWYLLLWSWLL